jgi:hypothetical protein
VFPYEPPQYQLFRTRGASRTVLTAFVTLYFGKKPFSLPWLGKKNGAS